MKYNLIALLAIIGTCHAAYADSVAMGSDAAGHSANAASEGSQSAEASAASTVLAGSAAVAVPLWLSGSAAAGVGDALKDSGNTLWDAATGDRLDRPPLDNEITQPPPPATKSDAPCDPSPADAMRI